LVERLFGKKHIPYFENLKELNHEIWMFLILGLLPDKWKKEPDLFLEKGDV
jgi:hypothetical protein